MCWPIVSTAASCGCKWHDILYVVTLPSIGVRSTDVLTHEGTVGYPMCVAMPVSVRIVTL